ncbi:MAG: hypothetical protein NZ521_11230, partial [Flammeovirgaceae bacterium]|nr:hypothetical protein [Flammeovirgaceae bacterium]MDW8288775.1 hypothetical protein [Flammeovirgaceae bacterium]
DRQELAFSTSIDTLSAFTTERIVYTKKDTLVGGTVYSIFTVAQPSDKTFYLLNFTEVGANKGDYVVAAYTAQGRTYRWVAPQNGVPQGNFAPIKRLIPPNSRQMASLSGTYQITKKSHFFTEIAFSDHDKNLFSSQDDNDNRGIALKTGIQTVEQPFSHYLTLSYGVDGEYNSLHFKPIDRFREVEFDRNWSINPDTLQAAKEHILHGFFYLQTTSSLPFKGKLRYDSWKRYRPTQLSGVQHALSYRWEWRKWEFSLDNFWLKALLTQQSAQWQKTELLLKRREKWFSTGYRYSTDLHQVRQLPSQEVVRTAMHAKIHRLFLESSDSLTARYRWRWYADVVLREDAAPQKGELAKSNFTQELNLKLQQQTTKRQFQTWFTYRLLENLFPNLSPYEETVMFRCDWSESFWNQLI